MTLVAVFLGLLFCYSLASGRLERSVLTAPILFTVAGIAAHALVPELGGRRPSHELFLTVAEIGLVLLLFTDASRTDLGMLRSMRNLPVRLLSTGMLLTIVLGLVAALAVFPGLSVWQAGILAAILAPTDAGLGQVIVNSPRVPPKIRQALNVEAGLNDGLSVPFLLFFIALVGGGAADGQASLTRFLVEQLGFGALVGIAIGLVGGWLLGRAHRLGWMAHAWRQLGVVALPLLALVVSEAVGASMFIAAFVAGLAVQVGSTDAARDSVEFTEEWGQVFNLSVFFLFGILVASGWGRFGVRHALYALLSLTVVRMLPVALALWGTRLSRATVLFVGWFGPRGLASIVLGLVYLEQLPNPTGDSTIQLTVMATVLASTLVHGLSALPGIELYARCVTALPASAPEREGENVGKVGSGGRI